MKRAWVIAVLLVACGDNIAGVSVREYGAASRDAACRRLVRCGVLPDLATCERTNLGPIWASPHWFDWVDQGLIIWHPELAHACLEEVANRSCARTTGPLPEILACSAMYEGTLAEGEPCTSNSQCIGGECWATELDQACKIGTCIGAHPPAPVGLGETCGYAPCAEGYCSDINLCQPYRVEGEGCEGSNYCARGLICSYQRCRRLPDTGEYCDAACLQIRDVCGSDYRCRPAARAGEPCMWDGDCGYYLRCKWTSGEAPGKCASANVPTGGECKSTADCADLTSRCRYDQLADTNTCLPPKENGESCWESDDCASRFCDGTFICAPADACPSPSEL